MPINVPPGENMVALAGMYWFGDANISSSTFTASFDGDAMTQMDVQTWDNTDRLAMYGLSNPDPGVRNLVVNYASIPATELRCLGVVVGIYSGVGGIDNTVSATVTASTSSSVTVPSVNPAYRTVFLHGGRSHYSEYNRTKRASLRMSDSAGFLWWWSAIGGELLLGDAPGAASVASTATQDSQDNWDAIGVNLAAAPVSFSFGTVKVADPSTSMSLSVYRVQEIDPDRTWKISAKRNQKKVWTRDPQSVYDYTWDWADILTGDDDIASVEFRSSVPNGLEILSQNHTSTTATVWVRGPSAGDVTCHMTSDGGREDEATASIKVAQR
ncbi:hypothetical protein [Mycolicibacterium neoaurum]|uniref:phage fiber-tail adaptor protein n=1 Tax=Mycolicibacterium neoaurum TaxID=1795 RepID=UPI00056D9269|nr:hypothetical protein [Mycolicibacterium neoaurum]